MCIETCLVSDLSIMINDFRLTCFALDVCQKFEVIPIMSLNKLEIVPEHVRHIGEIINMSGTNLVFSVGPYCILLSWFFLL